MWKFCDFLCTLNHFRLLPERFINGPPTANLIDMKQIPYSCDVAFNYLWLCLTAPKHWFGITDELSEEDWRQFPSGEKVTFLTGVSLNRMRPRQLTAWPPGRSTFISGRMNLAPLHTTPSVKNGVYFSIHLPQILHSILIHFNFDAAKNLNRTKLGTARENVHLWYLFWHFSCYLINYKYFLISHNK